MQFVPIFEQKIKDATAIYPPSDPTLQGVFVVDDNDFVSWIDQSGERSEQLCNCEIFFIAVPCMCKPDQTNHWKHQDLIIYINDKLCRFCICQDRFVWRQEYSHISLFDTTSFVALSTDSLDYRTLRRYDLATGEHISDLLQVPSLLMDAQFVGQLWNGSKILMYGAGEYIWYQKQANGEYTTDNSFPVPGHSPLFYRLVDTDSLFYVSVASSLFFVYKLGNPNPLFTAEIRNTSFAVCHNTDTLYFSVQTNTTKYVLYRLIIESEDDTKPAKN